MDNGIRCDGGNTLIAGKVAGVEGKKVSHAMRFHCGDNPGIVRRFAFDGILQHQLFPHREDGWSIRQYRKVGLKNLNLAMDLVGSHTKPVLSQRAGSHNPALINRLRAYTQAFPLLDKQGNGSAGRHVHRVRGLKCSQQHIRVYHVSVHSCSSSRV